MSTVQPFYLQVENKRYKLCIRFPSFTATKMSPVKKSNSKFLVFFWLFCMSFSIFGAEPHFFVGWGGGDHNGCLLGGPDIVVITVRLDNFCLLVSTLATASSSSFVCSRADKTLWWLISTLVVVFGIFLLINIDNFTLEKTAGSFFHHCQYHYSGKIFKRSLMSVSITIQERSIINQDCFRLKIHNHWSSLH